MNSQYTLNYRVMYYDTDAGGVVHNLAYLRWVEEARTKMAIELGMGTAVMSTEGQIGATPGGFSAHADMRDMYDDIRADQDAMEEQYGTIVDCDYDFYTRIGMSMLDAAINKALNKLKDNDKGF